MSRPIDGEEPPSVADSLYPQSNDIISNAFNVSNSIDHRQQNCLYNSSDLFLPSFVIIDTIAATNLSVGISPMLQPSAHNIRRPNNQLELSRHDIMNLTPELSNQLVYAQGQSSVQTQTTSGNASTSIIATNSRLRNTGGEFPPNDVQEKKR